jgi:hypothetical protein
VRRRDRGSDERNINDRRGHLREVIEDEHVRSREYQGSSTVAEKYHMRGRG